MRYLVYVDGLYRHTRYSPEQSAAVRRLVAAGMPRDAIVRATGVPYFSLSYVAAMDHKSRVLPLEEDP